MLHIPGIARYDCERRPAAGFVSVVFRNMGEFVSGLLGRVLFIRVSLTVSLGAR